MAEVDYEDYGAAPRFNGHIAQRMINIAGALCSVAIVIGVAVWGYKLAVRDVNGVPVIRASADPMRVPPATPGGEIADHQGMAVNVIAERGAVEVLPDEIVLAPAPVELTAEDEPGLAQNLTAQADGTGSAAAPSLGASPDQIASVDTLSAGNDPTRPDPAIAAAPISSSDGDAIARALADALASDAPPLGEVTSLTEDVANAPQVAGGLTRSLRPMPRPDVVGLTDVRNVSAEAGSINEIDPASLTVGTRLVQLGAFDTGDQARREWTKLATRFGDLMSGKSAVVQTALSGGRTFFRLRAHGFDGEDDARRFCTALLAEGAACIPVAHR
jgi:hypothetical protein